MVREVNRLLGYQKYSMKDRWDCDRSVQMFIDYQNAINPSWNFEKAARCWNGGYYGDRKFSTLIYWSKVKSNLNNLPEIPTFRI